MSENEIIVREDLPKKITSLQSRLALELAQIIVTCIKNRIRKQKSTLVFRHFIMECITKEDITNELKNYFHPSQHEIKVAQIAITLYKYEKFFGGSKKGKFFRDFLNECMMLEDCSAEICSMYGLKFVEK